MKNNTNELYKNNLLKLDKDNINRLRKEFKQTFFEVGKFLSGSAIYDQILSIKPDDYESLMRLIKVMGCLKLIYQQDEKKIDDAAILVYQGMTLGASRHFQKAVKSYDKAIKLKPDISTTWCFRGITLMESEQYQIALNSIAQAIKLNPAYAHAWYIQGRLLEIQQRDKEAFDSYNKAIELDPNDADYWVMKGSFLLNKVGKPEEALTSLVTATNLQPNNSTAWLNKGFILQELQRYEESLKSFDKAISLKIEIDKKALCWSTKGSILNNYYINQKEAAIKCHDTAIKLNKYYAEAWCNRVGAVFNCRTNMNLKNELFKPREPRNPLDKRNFEGALATFTEALKYIKKESDLSGWKLLHRSIAKVYYLTGREKLWVNFTEAKIEYDKARTAYEIALPTQIDFDYLDVLEQLIIVLTELGETEKVDALTRQGSASLSSLLQDSKFSDWKKRQLALRFSGFNQLSVDLLVKDNPTKALETAERDKNACLSWFFEPVWQKQEDIINSPSFSDMQKLLTPNVAIIYWHISPVALTTFIIKFGDSHPKVLQQTQSTRTIHDFEKWCMVWKRDYRSYCQANSWDRPHHSWRKEMPSRLEELKSILSIFEIQKLTPGISQLILIPHRDLHLFPIHALFPESLTVRYLPSAKAGIKMPSDAQGVHNFLRLEGTASDLRLTSLETDTISKLYANPNQVKLDRETFSLLRLETEFEQAHATFHFSGHGSHNFANPSQSALLFDQVFNEEGKLKHEYKLTAAEIYHTLSPFLKHYHLATLSACEVGTATAETITAEYIGIASVILSSGLRTVISPLWRVEENFAALFMIELHRIITQEQENPSVALVKVKNWLRNLTYREYFKTPVFQKILKDSLKQIWEQTKSYLEKNPAEVSSEKFAQFLTQLQKQLQQLEQSEKIDTIELKPSLEKMWTQADEADEFRRAAPHQELEKIWEILNGVLSELDKDTQCREPDAKPFNHPYYLAAFTCQGLS